MSEAEDYDRLMEAFEALRSLAPEVRVERLQALRTDHPTWTDQLEALLEVDAEPQSPLEHGAGRMGLNHPTLVAAGPSRALPASIGERVGAYRLTEVIGRGGMGCVYRGEHAELGRVAAIKVLEPRLAADDDYVSRFLHEAKIVNDVHHANIVDVFDFIDTTSPRRVALVMELLRGPTLGALLSVRPLTPEETVKAVFQLCAALSAVHAQGVVHRDLKPDNAMFVEPVTDTPGALPDLKLVDFGVAKVADPLALHRTASGVLIGTPRYMAPEQFSAEGVSPATDVYALAELFVEMLTQRPVFSGNGLSLIQQKLSAEPVVIDLPPSTPEADALRGMLLECLHVDPALRPSLAQFGGSLATLFPQWRPAPSFVWTPPPNKARNARRWLPSLRWAAAIVSSLVAVSFMTAAALYATRPDIPMWMLFLMGSFDKTDHKGYVPFPSATPPPVGYPKQKAKLPLAIYDEGESPSLYKPVRRMGYAVGLDMRLDAKDPLTGATCLAVRLATKKSWAGAVWASPRDDMGSVPGGYDLTGATKLIFRARGDRGGEALKVGCGLVGRGAKYFDTARVEMTIKLTPEWKTYTLDLRGENLSRIKIGFFVAVVAVDDAISLYVDDIRYE